MSAASFPKADLSLLSWIALAPLAVSVYRSSGGAASFWAGFLAGLVQFLLLLIWIPEVLVRFGGLPTAGSWAVYLLLIAFFSCFPALSCLWTRYLIDRGGNTIFLFTFPAAWIAVEYARTYVPFGGFPWLLTGYSQTDSLAIIQISDFAGVYGVSFLILWFNTSLAWAWCEYPRWRRVTLPLVAGVLFLGGSYLYGSWKIMKWDAAPKRFAGALLQGNLSADEPASQLSWKFSDGYVRLADHLRGSGIDLLVLPESPSPLMFQSDPAYRKTLEDLARRYPLGIVFNNIAHERKSGEDRYFNSAYFLDRDGRELGRYDKIHLVPFGEYIPSRGLFSFVQSITQDVGDFTPGNTWTVVDLDGHPANVLICFEAIFPDLAREFVRRGSKLFVNLTNDGWYGDSAAPFQHLAMARWRAVENRRYLLRATNSGISAVIEPTGRLQSVTGLLREGICLGRFDFIGEETWYARHGDVFAIACVIMSFLSYAWSLMRRSHGRERPDGSV